MPAAPDILLRFQKLGVDPATVTERFIRGAGPGGQKINKTSSTVWLREPVSGIEVRCQAERSQAANREQAWRELGEKLEARLNGERDAARQAREAERRRTRQKSRGQKVRMIQTKRHRARHKAARRRVGDE